MNLAQTVISCDFKGSTKIATEPHPDGFIFTHKSCKKKNGENDLQLITDTIGGAYWVAR